MHALFVFPWLSIKIKIKEDKRTELHFFFFGSNVNKDDEKDIELKQNIFENWIQDTNFKQIKNIQIQQHKSDLFPLKLTKKKPKRGEENKFF